MCALLPAVIGGAAILGAGASAIQGSKNRKAQRQAMDANERQAQQQAQRSEQQFNKMNQKQPAIAQLFEQNRKAASSGLGSTFLTGTKGVTSLPLGGGPSLMGG